mgnify:CR=1 FL=1
MDPQSLEFLAPLGVGGVLAGVMFLMYRRDALRWQEQWKGQTDILLNVVKENTKVIATHSEIVRSLVRRLDKQLDE